MFKIINIKIEENIWNQLFYQKQLKISFNFNVFKCYRNKLVIITII